MSVFNGTPGLRIWPIGTKRLLGVVGADEEDDLLPENIRNLNLGDDKGLFGDFLVCPFETQKPGVMQFVCIELVSNYLIKPRN
jgi:hypothetical protein